MKHWQETAEILSQLTAEEAAGRRAAIATVVRISGSAYRRPGAKLLVRDDGGTSGSVSGGCLEADVRETALIVLRDGIPRLLHYDTASDDRTVFGLGLGCNGSVDIFVQEATTPAFLEPARRVQGALGGEEPIAISTVLKGGSAGHVSVLTADGAPYGSTGEPALDRKLAAGADDLLRRGETAVHEIGTVLVVSEYGEVLAPPMLYDRVLFPELAVIDGHGCGKHVVKRHRTEAIAVPWSPAALTDLDAPADYQRIQTELGRR